MAFTAISLVFLTLSTAQAVQGGLRSSLSEKAKCGEDRFIQMDVTIHNVTCTDLKRLNKMRHIVYENLQIPHSTFDNKVHAYYEADGMCLNTMSEAACNLAQNENDRWSVSWRGGGQCTYPEQQNCSHRKMATVENFLEHMASQKMGIKDWSFDMKRQHLTQDQLDAIKTVNAIKDDAKRALQEIKDETKTKVQKLQDAYTAELHRLKCEQETTKHAIALEEDRMKIRHKIEKEEAKEMSNSERDKVKSRHKNEIEELKEKVATLASMEKVNVERLARNMEIDENMLSKQVQLAKEKEKRQQLMWDKRLAVMYKLWEGQMLLDVTGEKRISERQLILQHDVQKALWQSQGNKCFDGEPLVEIQLRPVDSLQESSGYSNCNST